jgi:cyanophycinase-like exopeptidase
MYFGGDVLRAIGIRDTTVVPQEVEHREIRRGTAVGETASGAIHQRPPPQTTAELIDKP